MTAPARDFTVRVTFRGADRQVVREKVLYAPLPRQAQLHASAARNVLYGGAAGGAKSHGGRWHGIIGCLQHDGFKVLLLRRQFTELEQTHLLQIPLEVPIELARYDGSRHRLNFPRTRSILQFGHCNTEKDFEQYLSTEWDCIIIDEAGQFTPRQLALLRSRLRTTKPGVLPQYVLLSNPGGDGHLWLKQRFMSRDVDPDEEATYDPADYEFIPALYSDNPYLTAEYIHRLQSLPEAERRAYMEGDWDVFAGQFFHEWRRDPHTVAAFAIDPEWSVDAGMDWGYDPSPGVIEVAAFDPHGRAWVYLELKFHRKSPRAVAELLNEALKTPNERQLVIKGDTQMWTKGSADLKSGTSIAEEINNRLAELECGVTLVPADKDRINGWARVHQYLDPRRPQPEGGIGPWLRVLRPGAIGKGRGGGCPYLIATLPAQVHDDRQTGDMKKTATDHAADALRYLAMGLPPLTTLPDTETAPKPHHEVVHAQTRKVLARVLKRQNERYEAEVTGLADPGGTLEEPEDEGLVEDTFG